MELGLVKKWIISHDFFLDEQKDVFTFCSFPDERQFLLAICCAKDSFFSSLRGGVVDACQDGLGRTFCVVFFLAMSKEMERL